jgi:hypothetical protein
MLRYTILNVMFLVPRAKAFIIVYHSLFYMYNKNDKFNLESFLFLVFFIFIIFWVKITILLVVGYPYLSLLVSSDIIVKFFGLLNLDFETKKARYQHILMNCFLNNENSVSVTNEMKILLSVNKIYFNMKTFFMEFYKNVERPDLL